MIPFNINFRFSVMKFMREGRERFMMAAAAVAGFNDFNSCLVKDWLHIG